MASNPLVLFANTSSVYVPQVDVQSDWVQVGGTTYLLDFDAAPITDPTGEITASSRQIFSRGNRPSTRLALRMRYISAVDTTKTPSVRLFGSVAPGSIGAGWWHSLRSLGGDLANEIALDKILDLYPVTTESTRVTTPDPLKNVFDTLGCERFLVGVEQNWEVDGSTPTEAALEVRFW